MVLGGYCHKNSFLVVSCMTLHVRLWIWSIAAIITTAVPAVAQRSITFHESFEQQPRYWSWVEPYNGVELSRVYRGGGMVCVNLNDGTRWSYRSIPTKADTDWSTAVTFRYDTLVAGGSCGLLIGLPNSYAMFAVNPSKKSASVWLYNWSSKTWTTPKDINAANGKAVPSLKSAGTDNVISVRRTGRTVAMMVNNAPVYSWDAPNAFPDVVKPIESIGIVVYDKVAVQFRSFDVTFTPPDFNFLPNALKGASKSFAVELHANQSDRFSVIAPNGQSLYFVRSPEGRGDDIYSASKNTDSTWTNVQPIGYPLNNTSPNNVVSISQDDNELLVFGKYNADGSWAGTGFSRTKRTTYGWSLPAPINIDDYRNHASTREECVSPDWNVMILSCNRDSTKYPSKDLHVSFRKPDGSYSVPVRLSEPINSSEVDGMPFIAADGKTLYFASERPGFGSADIWVTKRLDDTWLRWTEPINMGPNVNTMGWDGYFTIHPSGRYAYMNSTDGYRSGIVRVSLPRDEASKALLPDPLVVVTGRVTNGRTGEPIGTTIRIAQLNSSKSPTQAVSEPGNGEYSIVLPGGTDYAFYAERSGFFPVSENLELSTLGAYLEIRRDLTLYPIEVGSVIRLNNVFFDTDKWDLRTQSSEELMRLAEMLKQRPTVVIEVGGHTDDRASDAHNKTLSTNRAQAVVAFLSKNGVAPSQMTAVGYGKTKPVATGTTDEARQRNRRVEFTVVKQ